jgi:predicted phage-related endonuclease
MIQCRHYYAVTDINNVVLAACVAGLGLVVRAIEFTEYDKQFHIEQIHKFWNHVVTGVPPDPDGSPSSLATVKQLFPSSEPNLIVEADDFVATTFERYVKAVDAENEATALKNELKAKLALAIGKGEEMVYDGRSLFTYKSARKFDQDKFIKDHPELVAVFASFDPSLLKQINPALYDEYMAEGEGSRSIKLKGEK